MIDVKISITYLILITPVVYIAICIAVFKNLVSPIFDLKFKFLFLFIPLHLG